MGGRRGGSTGVGLGMRERLRERNWLSIIEKCIFRREGGSKGVRIIIGDKEENEEYAPSPGGRGLFFSLLPGEKVTDLYGGGSNAISRALNRRASSDVNDGWVTHKGASFTALPQRVSSHILSNRLEKRSDAFTFFTYIHIKIKIHKRVRRRAYFSGVGVAGGWGRENCVNTP